jgi:L-Ala-D/L-Glu epimerase
VGIVIDNIQAVLLLIPRKRGMSLSENLVVQIRSSDGVLGVGACQYEPRFGETGAEAALLVNEHYAPLLINEDPLSIESAMAKLDDFIPEHLPSKAAVDIALHDLKGKTLGVPVYHLLGGLARQKVQLLAPQISRVSPKEQAKEAAQWVEKGFKALKLRAGGSNVEEDIERVKEVRQAVGGSVEIRIDANEYYEPVSAVNLTKRLEPYDLAWVEDPIPAWDLEGFAHIRHKANVPIEFGQLGTTMEMLRLIRMEAADCFKMKVTRGGGLMKAKKAIAIAQTSNRFLVSGSGSDNDINFAAEVAFNASSLHASRACESTGAWSNYPEEARIVKEPLVVKDGYAYPSPKPGLGVELITSDLSALAKKFSR